MHVRTQSKVVQGTSNQKEKKKWEQEGFLEKDAADGEDFPSFTHLIYSGKANLCWENPLLYLENTVVGKHWVDGKTTSQPLKSQPETCVAFPDKKQTPRQHRATDKTKGGDRNVKTPVWRSVSWILIFLHYSVLLTSETVVTGLQR